MLSRAELREIAKIRGEGAFFVSLYLNVNPMTNVKDNYAIHVKSMLKQKADQLDKAVLKKVGGDFEKIEAYILTNKKIFRKGLALLCSGEKKFWKEFHLAVPFKNEVIVDSTPYIKPLLDILDNYPRYAILLVDKESARLFRIHLGEIEEYTEVHSADVPGKHKKGGWFALSEKSFERHTDYHVGLHLKDVIKQLESFLSGEFAGRLIIGGAEEAAVKVKAMLPQATGEKVIGTVQADMTANVNEILRKAEPILQAYEKKIEIEDIDTLITSAMKNENAALGIENVLATLQEGRIMKLFLLKDYKQAGISCTQCGYMTVQGISACPYCKGGMQAAPYMVDLVAQKAVEQGAFVKVASENRKLQDAGGIGAFLRF